MTAAVVGFFSGVYYPMIHLAVTGYTPALILSVLFVLMVSHEILAWLLYVVSRGRGKSAQHFIAISLIYLFNVMVAALHEAGVVQWNFLYINVFLLLTVSAILGIWGFRERETLYDNIMPFAPTGSYFIVALGAICCMTIAFLLDNHNDAAVKIVRDITIFAHAGYGLIFFTYVLSNFAQMLGRHLPIHKVVYKPNRMPYFTFRLAGLIALLAFVFYSNWATYVYNGIAGFYNQLGDLYTLLERRAVAESYYEQGRSNGFGNNHANYALGNMKAARYDFEDALVNYDLANIRRPTTYALINEGNVYFWSDEIRKSVQAYLRGLKEFPNAGPLHNNLGFMYGRVQEIDSALYYLSEASNYDVSKNSAEANSFAVAAMEYLPLNADSLLKSLETNYTATIANALALATSQGQDMEVDESLLDQQRLNLYTATLLNNYLVRHAKDLDSATMERIFRVADDSLNVDYSEALKASLAPCYYHGGNVRKAIALLSQQAFGSQSYGGKYNYIIGLWILEQGNPSAAARYFQYASLEDYKEASLYRAIALTEDGDVPQAVAAWHDVAGNDTLSVVAAQQITRILTMPRQQAVGLADPEKYQFCRYRLHAMDTLAFDGLMETFATANYKALSLIEMAQRQFDWDNRSKAIQYLNRIDGLDLNDPQLLSDIHNLQLLILAEQRDTASLSEKLTTSPGLGAAPFLERVLAEAVIAEARNDTVTAAHHFEILANYNSYFEPGIIAAADYFRKHSDDPLKAYTILAEACR
ncbi:MAG: hypothetical protein HC859_15285 [Bacteroidia bacterium]|nr:hypothetical protein [Bacteroidia bacterium]